MKNILIYGGFNWFGYELTNILIKGNMVTNIIIVDTMKRYLHKNNIKEKFDNYAHLYDENLFLYVTNIKDKDNLLEIYKKHEIHIVINNIKYNIYDSIQEKEDIKIGCQNVMEIHNEFGISNYLYIHRQYTHNKALLNNQCRNIVEDNLYFNEAVSKISSNMGIEILIPDYIFGHRKDKHSNIFVKIFNILKIRSPLIIPKDERFFCLCDIDLIMYVLKVVFERDTEQLIDSYVIGPFHYDKIVEQIKNPEISNFEGCKLREYILSLS